MNTTSCVVSPPGPMAVALKVVESCGTIVYEPCDANSPMPAMVTLVACKEVHAKVTGCPGSAKAVEIVNSISGFGWDRVDDEVCSTEATGGETRSPPHPLVIAQVKVRINRAQERRDAAIIA